VKTFRALFPSDYKSVGTARRAVAGFASDCGFGVETVSDIALAVGEACNNAAEHGHVHGGFFTIECKYDGTEIEIHVKDIGRGFDPIGKGEPIEPEHRDVRGLGIFTMRALMDSVTYATSDRGTKVLLLKRTRQVADRPRSGGQSPRATGANRSMKAPVDKPARWA